MQTTTNPNLENRRWLLKLLGAEELAHLTRPLTDVETARLDELFTQAEREMPAHFAIMAAPEAELPAVIGRLLTEVPQ